MDKIFTNLVKGFEDKEIKEDTIYQENIKGIEKEYKGTIVEPLSKDTIIEEPFYSNMFQSLINHEAENRFVKNFYNESKQKNEANEVDSFDRFIENFSDIIYELDNVKTVTTFNEGGYLTSDNGFVVETNDGHKYQITIVQER